MDQERQRCRASHAILAVTGAWLAVLSPASAQQADGAKATFRSPVECVHLLKLDPVRCAAIMQRAWLFYLDNTPRYTDRTDCWRNHKVCVLLPIDRILNGPPPVGRPPRKTPAAVFSPMASYAPPLWAIRFDLRDADGEPEVLVDRAMVPLQVTQLTSIPVTGRFAPGPERVMQIYLDLLVQKPAEPPNGRSAGRATPEPQTPPGVFSPVDSYPVAPARLQSIRRALRR
jgi:hypothetical protein